MSDNHSQPTIIVEKSGSGLGAFVMGALVGAATALLFAPKSGEETQRELREGARKLRRGAEEKMSELRDSIEHGVERAREDVSERVVTAREEVRERKRQAEEALKAGKEAAKQARGDLEKRVAESKAAYKAALTEGEEDADAEAS
ncbi:MAG: YtxH domain-containing protein [Gemmatimonadota bacterium]